MVEGSVVRDNESHLACRDCGRARDETEHHGGCTHHAVSPVVEPDLDDLACSMGWLARGNGCRAAAKAVDHTTDKGR